MALPGFPEDFQPQCHAEVTFNVKAKTDEDEAIVVIGNVVTLGEGDISNGVVLSADDTPTSWSGTVDVPANTKVSYQVCIWPTNHDQGRKRHTCL